MEIIDVKEAVERMKPKRPLASASGKYGACPCCECLISKYEPAHGNLIIKHCKWCGQAIDWEKEKTDNG